MTEDEIQRGIDFANYIAEEEAQDDYTRQTGKELLKCCHRLTEETSERYALVMQGKSPLAFGEYDRDDIARVLNADVVLYCDGYELNLSDDVDFDKITDWQDGALETDWDTEAEESRDRLAFVEAFEKYLHTAAAFAKSIGALHAMRLYLKAWGIVKENRERRKYRFRLDADAALRVVNLERVASERLWLDVEAAKLPAFKPRRAKPRGGAKSFAKTRKTRKGRG